MLVFDWIFSVYITVLVQLVITGVFPMCILFDKGIPVTAPRRERERERESEREREVEM